MALAVEVATGAPLPATEQLRGEGVEDDTGSWAGPRPGGLGGFSWAKGQGRFSFLFLLFSFFVFCFALVIKYLGNL